MSCTGCASKFGLLKSEHGCPGCGFSFCGKCLSEKASLKENSKPVAVCKNCAASRTNPERRQSHPASIISSLYNPPSGDLPPPSMRQAAKLRSTSVTADQKSSPEERALRERLDRLKEEFRGPPVSQTELEIRLARLKGKSFDEHVAEKTAPYYFGPDNRTPAQRAADLMSQMREEMELERKLRRPEEEIAERLAKLKGEDVKDNLQSKQSGTGTNLGQVTENVPADPEAIVQDDGKELSEVERLMRDAQRESETEARSALENIKKDKELMEQLRKIRGNVAKEDDQTGASAAGEKQFDDEEDAKAETLAKMIMEEDEITARLSRLAPPPSTLGDARPSCPSPFSEQEFEDELPWCCICTEDASVRCMGCDGDLYCRRCFREGHDQFDLKEHTTVPYAKKIDPNDYL